MERQELPCSRMRFWQSAAVILWLPMHTWGFPRLLLRLYPGIGVINLNFWNYAVGAGLLSLLCWSFLRRDFDRIWENPGKILGMALGGCVLLMGANMAMSAIVFALVPQDNPNNQAVFDLVRTGRGRILATTVILAPVVEELIFRGGVFGLVRRGNRFAAYAVCILLFGVYHTWQYALADPANWLFVLEYLPAGFLLCFCYDRTECIWTPILLHMVNNSLTLLISGV